MWFCTARINFSKQYMLPTTFGVRIPLHTQNLQYGHSRHFFWVKYLLLTSIKTTSDILYEGTSLFSNVSDVFYDSRSKSWPKYDLRCVKETRCSICSHCVVLPSINRFVYFSSNIGAIPRASIYTLSAILITFWLSIVEWLQNCFPAIRVLTAMKIMFGLFAKQIQWIELVILYTR